MLGVIAFVICAAHTLSSLVAVDTTGSGMPLLGCFWTWAYCGWVVRHMAMRDEHRRMRDVHLAELRHHARILGWKDLQALIQAIIDGKPPRANA